MIRHGLPQVFDSLIPVEVLDDSVIGLLDRL